MKKNKIPPPENYSNAADYFQAFITINKEINPIFSYRYLAKKLKWPSGYISDVIASRKSFTLLRALQFADTYGMRSSDKERLIWFALVESENAEVKMFFQKKLNLSPNDVLNPSAVINDPDLYNTIAAVSDFLILKKHKMTATQIIKELRLSYLTKEKVTKALSQIEKNRYLVWNTSGELIENNANFSFDNYGDKDGKPYINIELHKEPALNFLKFIESPSGPATYNTGVIQVRKDQFLPLALQIISMRNSLLEASQENVRTAGSEDTHRLMQFDLNLFAVSDLS